MADTVNKLQLTFVTGDGSTVTHSYKYADPEVTDAAVNALVSTTLSNASIFAKSPVAIKDKKLVTTTTKVFNS